MQRAGVESNNLPPRRTEIRRGALPLSYPRMFYFSSGKLDK